MDVFCFPLQSGKGSVGVRQALGETQLIQETKQFLTENGIALDSFGQVRYGGGGFFFACKDFFFKVEISLCTLLPLFTPGSVHSGSASWDDRGIVFPDELHVSLFPDMFQHYARTAAKSAHSNFIGSVVYAYLGVTCHLHF